MWHTSMSKTSHTTWSLYVLLVERGTVTNVSDTRFTSLFNPTHFVGARVLGCFEFKGGYKLFFILYFPINNTPTSKKGMSLWVGFGLGS